MPLIPPTVCNSGSPAGPFLPPPAASAGSRYVPPARRGVRARGGWPSLQPAVPPTPPKKRNRPRGYFLPPSEPVNISASEKKKRKQNQKNNNSLHQHHCSVFAARQICNIAKKMRSERKAKLGTGLKNNSSTLILAKSIYIAGDSGTSKAPSLRGNTMTSQKKKN